MLHVKDEKNADSPPISEYAHEIDDTRIQDTISAEKRIPLHSLLIITSILNYIIAIHYVANILVKTKKIK